MTPWTCSNQIESIENVKRKHKGHFFSPDAMRFFKSKVYEIAVLHENKWLFGTSEKGPDNVRRYTLRTIDENGTIDTITMTEFGQFKTKAQLDRYVSKLIGRKITL